MIELPDWFMEAAKPDPGDLALEIGCGFGEWMLPLARHVAFVCGFGIHPQTIENGLRLAFRNSVGNVAFAVGDGHKIPSSFSCAQDVDGEPMYVPAIEDGIVTLVYSISAFQHLSRSIVIEYLTETVRVLASGGRCLHQFSGWTIEEVRDAGVTAGLKHVNVIDGPVLLLYGEK